MADLRAKLEAVGKPRPGLCLKCDEPAVKPKRHCFWHIEALSPPAEKAAAALKRRSLWDGQRQRADGSCAGCGAKDVPSWYRAGSRCKSCGILDRRTQTFGLTTEQQIALEKLGNGKCMICGNAQQKVALSVDHSHYSGDVRGLLCGRGGTSCNETIGWWFDDPKRFLATAIYLIDPPARKLGIGDRPLRDVEVLSEILDMAREILRERST